MGNSNVGTTGFSTSYDANEGGQLEDLYNAPAASSMRTGRMTMDDVVTRTGMLFAILLVTGGFAWKSNLGGGALIGSLIGATVLGLVISFSRKVRPALVITYAALEGIVLGTISAAYESAYPGIISQALIATAVAFVGVLVAYRSGKISITARATKIATGAMIGYLILGVINMIGGNFIFNGTFGPLVAVFGVGLATFFLAMDFDQAAKAAAATTPLVMPEATWRTVGEFILAFIPDAKISTGNDIVSAFTAAQKRQQEIAAAIAQAAATPLVEETVTEVVVETTVVETVAEPIADVVVASSEEATPAVVSLPVSSTWYTVGEYIAAFVPDAKPVTGADIISAFISAQKKQQELAANNG